MTKIDAHQHFWHYNPVDYDWISDEMPVLRKDRLPGDLYPELKKSGFDGCVTVQARQTRGETDFLVKLANENSLIKGVVGWLDLCSDQIEKDLEEIANLPKVCGLRHVVQDEPDTEYLLRKDFKRGISELRHFDLCYDILIYPKHLPVAVEFVDAFPDQKFVLDHIAKPLIKDRILSPWNTHIKQLAQRPNVYCKLSGMVTETTWHGWEADDFTPYLDVVFEAFGTERLMVGSDWPVCTLAGSYSEVIDIVERYTNSFSEQEKENIFGRNAIRFYGLEL